MPGIRATLANHDLDFLNRIARFWKTEISQRDVQSASDDLYACMTNRENLLLALEQLPQAAQPAWQHLVSKGGKMPWAVFSRKYGEIRDFGPASREREKPDQNPISASESLWYSGLVGKAFLKISSDLVETVYIPDEIFGLISPPNQETRPMTLRPAINQKPRFVELATTSLLDRLTDFLAAMRMSRTLPESVFDAWKTPQPFLSGLLLASGLVDQDGHPIPESLKRFFQQDRGKILSEFYQMWLASKEINELRMLPELVCEGSWVNDPIPPRRLLLEILSGLGGQTWWSISSLLSTIKEQTPDFQRPAGDYDSWFIRQSGTENYLRGFHHWDEVEGRLLYFLLTGPLHWLGILNLARKESEGKFNAFQLTETAHDLMAGKTNNLSVEEPGVLEFRSSTEIIIPNGTSRELRYQIGRFYDFSFATTAESGYRLTPASLERATAQGLNIGQLVQLLEKHSLKPIPTTLKRLAQRWLEHGLEAELTTGVLLRFASEEACALFSREPRAARTIVEMLNAQTILIHRESIEHALRLLAELGILAQVEPGL